MKRALESQTGFTLMELMVALFVLSFVVAGYIGANVMAQRNTEEMHERTVAIQDANRLIERMRCASRSVTVFPDNLVSLYQGDITELDEETNQEKPVFNNLTNEKTTVTYGAGDGNRLDVTVTVTWSSYTGRANSSQAVRAYITQR